MNRILILFLLLQSYSYASDTEFINYKEGYKFNLPEGWCVFKREVIEIHTSTDTVFSEKEPYYNGTYFCQAYTFNEETPIKDHNDLLNRIQNHYNEKAWNGAYTINNIELVSKNNNKFVKYFVLKTIDDSYLKKNELSNNEKYEYIYGISDLNNSSAYGIACALNKSKLKELKNNIDYIFDSYTKEPINASKGSNIEISGCYGHLEDPRISRLDKDEIGIVSEMYKNIPIEGQECISEYYKDYTKKYLQYCFQENLGDSHPGGCYHHLNFFSAHPGVTKQAMMICEEKLKHNQSLKHGTAQSAAP
ncbi:MAG: hypothetical protein RIB78_09250 [Gammaproteobacteria bacterium]